MGPLLELEHVSKSFGAVRVADDFSLRLDAGEALGIVGPNGAGKTSLLNLIGGTIPPDSGRIMFEGVDITRAAAHVRCRRGIGRTHQIPEPFEGLTVFENVLAGLAFGGADSKENAFGSAMTLLDRVDLAGKANVLAGALTLLERKRLELARALATRPRLLLLDEIGGGLVEAELEVLIASIEELRREGTTIIWIEHIVHALLSVVDRLVAMHFGEVLADGRPDEVLASREVQAVYMGVVDE
ncbi:MAG: ABC transporter ATP-binding protein [Actinomycetota bacterium]